MVIPYLLIGDLQNVHVIDAETKKWTMYQMPIPQELPLTAVRKAMLDGSLYVIVPSGIKPEREWAVIPTYDVNFALVETSSVDGLCYLSEVEVDFWGMIKDWRNV